MEGLVADVGSDYLEAAAVLLAAAKRLSYRRMKARPGAALLDVGCGPGIDTVGLAGYVGPTGRVDGIDRNDEMVAAADRRAASAGVSARVTHHCGDAADLPFADDMFDAVRSERLFLHLSDPAAALAEMVRVARPGGRVVVLDTDFGSHSVDALDLRTQQALLRTLAETSLLNGYSGRRLLGLMKQAALARLSATLLPLRFTDYEFWRFIVRMDEVEEAALRTGSVSAAALDRWHGEMRERTASGTFFASLTLVLVAGTKRPDRRPSGAPRAPAGGRS